MQSLCRAGAKALNTGKYRSTIASLLNFRANVPRTFVPWNFRTLGTFAPQTTFVPFNFRSYGLLAVITATRASGSLVKQR